MSRLSIRDMRDEDLQHLVRANNAYYVDNPTTEKKQAHERHTRPESMKAHDTVGLVDGEPAIFGTCLEAIWYPEPGCTFVHYLLRPDLSGTTEEREFFDHLCEMAWARGSDRLNTALTDIHDHHIGTVEGAGFEFAMRNPVTAIDPQAFDPSTYQCRIDAVVTSGLRIRSISDLAQEVPDWKRRFFDFTSAVLPDVPSPEPIVPMPWDEFDRFIGDPERYSLEGKFAALDGEDFAGVSEIQQNSADPTIGHTMLTGVRREYRRRGIATALKASALGWAKSQGMRRVMTDNEERNPMLDLNKQLGFCEVYSIRTYRKLR